ncbi:MAG: PspA/IM30 family protein [Candidatus Poribacteria bacterium]|nr:PspA/IM30 family protein [Candidatus Poribacteria bacterium]
MQTLDRAKLIVKAQVSDLLTKLEDGQKTRQLALEEVREDMRGIKSLVVSAIADLKLIERQIEEADAEAEKWGERAAFALQKAEEDLARRALARKHELTRKAERYREQLTAQRDTIETLKSGLKSLESKLEGMRFNAARMDVQEKLSRQPAFGAPSASDYVIGDGAFDAYDRMVEQVRDLEAHAEAFEELMQGDKLEREFHALERKNEVDKDLAALKSKLAADD